MFHTNCISRQICRSYSKRWRTGRSLSGLSYTVTQWNYKTKPLYFSIPVSCSCLSYRLSSSDYKTTVIIVRFFCTQWPDLNTKRAFFFSCLKHTGVSLLVLRSSTIWTKTGVLNIREITRYVSSKPRETTRSACCGSNLRFPNFTIKHEIFFAFSHLWSKYLILNFSGDVNVNMFNVLKWLLADFPLSTGMAFLVITISVVFEFMITQTCVWRPTATFSQRMSYLKNFSATLSTSYSPYTSLVYKRGI